MTTSSSERLDVYTAITDQIIAAIEAGADNPKMPCIVPVVSSNAPSMSPAARAIAA